MLGFLKNMVRGDRLATDLHSSSLGGEDHSAPYYVHTGRGARVEVIAHARALGRENLPESSAREPNDVESAIVQEHERRHEELLDETRGRLRSLVAEFDRLERSLPAPRDVQGVVQRADAAVRQDLALDTALVPRWQETQQSRRDLRHFAASRGLTRPARYPQSRLGHFAWLGPLLVLESIANAMFFAGASPWGLAGGFVTAVLVSGINLSAGALAGYFPLRWRTHPKVLLQRLATAALVCYAAFAVSFNWIVACYRDAAAAGAVLGLGALLHHWHNLGLPSCALFVMGLICTALAVRKGFTACDAHPGYAERDRSFRAAQEAFTAARDGLRHGVLGYAASIPGKCEALVRRAEEIVGQLGELVVRAEGALETYEKHRASIAHWCRLWLTRYRSENANLRTTAAPGYFSLLPAFPPQVDHAVVAELTTRLHAAAATLGVLKAEVHAVLLGQPQRAAAAGDQFESFLKERLYRADLGRGDGSTHPVGDPPEPTEVAS